MVAVVSDRLVIAGITTLSGLSPRSKETWALQSANTEITKKLKKLHAKAIDTKEIRLAPCLADNRKDITPNITCMKAAGISTSIMDIPDSLSSSPKLLA